MRYSNTAITPKITKLFLSPLLSNEQRGYALTLILSTTTPPPPSPHFPTEQLAILQQILFLHQDKLKVNKALMANKLSGAIKFYSKSSIPKIPLHKINQISRAFGDFTVTHQDGAIVQAISKATKKTITTNVGRIESGFVTGRSNKNINPNRQTKNHRNTDTFQLFYKKLYLSYVLLDSLNNPNTQQYSLTNALNFPDFLDIYEPHIAEAKLQLLDHNIPLSLAIYHLRVTPTNITFTPTPNTNNLILITKK